MPVPNYVVVTQDSQGKIHVWGKGGRDAEPFETPYEATKWRRKGEKSAERKKRLGLPGGLTKYSTHKIIDVEATREPTL